MKLLVPSISVQYGLMLQLMLHSYRLISISILHHIQCYFVLINNLLFLFFSVTKQTSKEKIFILFSPNT